MMSNMKPICWISGAVCMFLLGGLVTVIVMKRCAKKHKEEFDVCDEFDKDNTKDYIDIKDSANKEVKHGGE